MSGIISRLEGPASCLHLILTRVASILLQLRVMGGKRRETLGSGKGKGQRLGGEVGWSPAEVPRSGGERARRPSQGPIQGQAWRGVSPYLTQLVQGSSC